MSTLPALAVSALLSATALTEVYRPRGGPQFINSPWGKSYPRIQLLTIEDLLGGKGVDYPHAADVTFKKAQRVRQKTEKQKSLLD